MIADFGLGGFEGKFAIFKSDPARKILGGVGEGIVFWVGGGESVFSSSIFVDSELVGRSPGGSFVDIGNVDSDISFGG